MTRREDEHRADWDSRIEYGIGDEGHIIFVAASSFQLLVLDRRQQQRCSRICMIWYEYDTWRHQRPESANAHHTRELRFALISQSSFLRSETLTEEKKKHLKIRLEMIWWLKTPDTPTWVIYMILVWYDTSTSRRHGGIAETGAKWLKRRWLVQLDEYNLQGYGRY